MEVLFEAHPSLGGCVGPVPFGDGYFETARLIDDDVCARDCFEVWSLGGFLDSQSQPDFPLR